MRRCLRAALLLPLLLATGCRDQDCVETAMAAEPAVVTSASDAVLRVRITAEGRPVSDTPVSFSIRTPDGERASLDVGTTRTNAEGVGEYRLDNELLSSFRVERMRLAQEYEATSGHRAGGRYCRASAKASFSFRMVTTP